MTAEVEPKCEWLSYVRKGTDKKGTDIRRNKTKTIVWHYSGTCSR